MPLSKKEAERDMLKVINALILVPDVHHAIQLFFVGLHDVDVQQAVPVGFQFGKGSIYFGGSVEGRNHRLSLYLIYNR